MLRDLDGRFDDLWGDEDEDEVVEVEEEEVNVEPEEEEDTKHLYFGASASPVKIRQDHTQYDLEYVPAWDDQFEPDESLFEKLAICIGLNQPVLLVGPRGSGKSSTVRALAAAIHQPLRRINLTGQTRVKDFVGHQTLGYEEDEEGDLVQVLKYIYGILPDSMRNNHWLLVDELDAAPPSVTFAMQAVLEPERTLVLTQNRSETIVPPGMEDDTSHFRIFATANTLGYGDDTGFYAGTNIMNMATLDRFAVIRVGYPTQENELEILKSRAGLSETVLWAMVDFANKIRGSVKQDNCGIGVSTRQLVQWGQMTAKIWGREPSAFLFPSKDDKTDPCQQAIVLAYEMTVSGKLPEDDEQFYAGVFQRSFGFGAELS